MLGQVVSLISFAGLFGFSPRGVVHFAFDAALVSACLAGIKRSAGLSPAVKRLQHKELEQLAVGYLEIGEWIMDLMIVVMGRSSFFERRR